MSGWGEMDRWEGRWMEGWAISGRKRKLVTS